MVAPSDLRHAAARMLSTGAGGGTAPPALPGRFPAGVRAVSAERAVSSPSVGAALSWEGLRVSGVDLVVSASDVVSEPGEGARVSAVGGPGLTALSEAAGVLSEDWRAMLSPTGVCPSAAGGRIRARAASSHTAETAESEDMNTCVNRVASLLNLTLILTSSPS
jgi:hypothetical protein